MPLMQKRRRLVKIGQADQVQEGPIAETVRPGRDEATQEAAGSSRAIETAAGAGEGQGLLPLVPVPFEGVPKKGTWGRIK